MRPEDLIAMLTQGLDPDIAAKVTAQIQSDVVKTKLAGYKAQSEFDAIMTDRQKLQAELDGDAAAGKLSARATREWYEKNSAAVIANDKAIKAFEDKHGTGTFAKLAAGEFTIPAAPGTDQTAALTQEQITAMVDARITAGVKPAVAKEDVARIVNETIQGTYATQWSSLLEGTGNIVQKHMFAKREKPIDFKELSKIAGEKNIPLEAAYDVWDAPERQKVEAAQRSQEIADAVKAERQKWDDERVKENATKMFPAGADASPGSLFKTAPKEFDMNQLRADMAKDLAGAVN